MVSYQLKLFQCFEKDKGWYSVLMLNCKYADCSWELTSVSLVLVWILAVTEHYFTFSYHTIGLVHLME